jgi:hypothetical protein
MTGPLRRSHFHTWIVLAVALTTLLVAALSARKATTPVNPEWSWERLR